MAWHTAFAAGQVPATDTNDAAAAGCVGEHLFASLAIGSAVSLTDNVPVNITSKEFPAGEWWIWADGHFVTATTTNTTRRQVGVSSVSATLDSGPRTKTDQYGTGGLVFGASEGNIIVPWCQFLLAAPTTIYAVAAARFTLDAQTVYGSIFGVRIR